MFGELFDRGCSPVVDLLEFRDVEGIQCLPVAPTVAHALTGHRHPNRLARATQRSSSTFRAIPARPALRMELIVHADCDNDGFHSLGSRSLST